VKKGEGGPQKQEIQHHSSEYNIWYHKKLGDRFERDAARVKSLTRCNVATDTGYTRANVKGSKDSYICVFFLQKDIVQTVQHAIFFTEFP